MARLRRAILVARAISGRPPSSFWRWPPCSRGTRRSAPSMRATFVVRPGGCRPLRPRLPGAGDRADPAVARRTAHLRRALPAVRLGAARRDHAGDRHRHPGTRPRSGGCFRPARRHHGVDRGRSRRAPERPSPTRGGPPLEGPGGDGRLGEPSARRGRGSASLRPFVPLSRARGRVVPPVRMRGATAVDSSRVTHLLSPE